jgi:hypothetical protein
MKSSSCLYGTDTDCPKIITFYGLSSYLPGKGLIVPSGSLCLFEKLAEHTFALRHTSSHGNYVRKEIIEYP